MIKSHIQWTDITWNPWYGCTKVSDGCKYCYMYRDQERYHNDPTQVRRSKKGTFDRPYKVKNKAMIFTCSWSDFFIEDADEWRAEAWKIIKDTPHLIYQILTKRPKRIKECLPDDWGNGYPNVWLGVSIENNNSIKRLRELVKIPAQIRFISAEPLLEDISENLSFDLSVFEDKIDWIIVGGESGFDNHKYTYRECEFKWIEKIISTGALHAIPVFVKQIGSYLSKEMNCKDIKGGDITEWPDWLKVREYPSVKI